MRDFTKEEMDVLEVYEGRFRSALDLGFVRNLEPKYLSQIKAIYDDAEGVSSSLNASCSHCVLGFMKSVGKKYFECKDKLEEKAAKLVETLDEIFGEVPDEEPAPKKKPTNKKTNKKK